ncbi:MAG: protein-disulfide reductase DsbD [Bdellovibrionales bacterium]|nr:protein-disulfide reductase DsbD [Bdellovibrionales bacterium]
MLRLILVLGVVTSFWSAWANDDDINEDPLTVKPHVTETAVPPGGNLELDLELHLPPGYRAYLKMFKLESDNKMIKVSPFKVEPLVSFKDPLSGEEKKGIVENALMSATIQVDPKHEKGNHKTELSLTYQACTVEVCLFPKKIPVSISYMIQGDAVSGSSMGPSTFEEALGKGAIYAFLFVFFAGVLTSLTPCIFPMIPITLSILGTRTAGQSKVRGFLLSLSYVFGIGITYAILGVAAARTGALFGSALSNPIVVGVIAALFVVMGLSMYGLFEIQVPAFLRNRLGGKKTGSGFVGAFFAGLIAGVVASPCVGPVLVSVLAYVAQTQDSVFGFFLLFTFALGMGILFMILGTFGQALSYLPKAGGWMEGVKFVFGTTMIGMAFYYLRPILNPREFYGLAGAACILIASGFGAFAPAEPSTPKQIKKGLLLSIFIIGVVYLLNAVFERELRSLSQTQVGESIMGDAHAKSAINWQPYTDSAFNEAISKRQPIIIDFWAEWCSACNELVRYTFSDSRVQVESQNFVMLKIDATLDTPEIGRLRKYFNVLGLPTVLFYDPKGELRKDLTLTGFEKSSQFLERMAKARAVD